VTVGIMLAAAFAAGAIIAVLLHNLGNPLVLGA